MFYLEHWLTKYRAASASCVLEPLCCLYMLIRRMRRINKQFELQHSFLKDLFKPFKHKVAHKVILLFKTRSFCYLICIFLS